MGALDQVVRASILSIHKSPIGRKMVNSNAIKVTPQLVCVCACFYIIVRDSMTAQLQLHDHKNGCVEHCFVLRSACPIQRRQRKTLPYSHAEYPRGQFALQSECMLRMVGAEISFGLDFDRNVQRTARVAFAYP